MFQRVRIEQIISNVYSNSDLRDWLRQFQDQAHGPISWKDYKVILCSGSQEALSLIVSTVLEPNDTIIMQTPSYPGTLSVVRLI